MLGGFVTFFVVVFLTILLLLDRLLQLSNVIDFPGKEEEVAQSIRTVDYFIERDGITSSFI